MDGGELDEAEVGVCELVVAGRDPSELLKFSEEAFDAVARGVEIPVVAVLMLSLTSRRDHGACALVQDEVVEAVCIVRAVCQKRASMDALHEAICGGHLVLLAGAEAEPDRQRQCVGHGVELGAEAPA